MRAQVETLPAEQRKLVTDHVALGYFAAEYGFEVVGSVVAVVEHAGVGLGAGIRCVAGGDGGGGCAALFVGTTVNAQTARQLANDLGIPVVELYTGSLSEARRTGVDLCGVDALRRGADCGGAAVTE